MDLSVFAASEARNKQIVDSSTWGHLFPKKGKHRGYVVFAQTAYGQTEIVDAEFEDTDSSPWLYNAVQDMIYRQEDLDAGVYVWRGYCYTEKVLEREADPDDPDDENDYAEVVRLQGKITGMRSIKELIAGI